MDTYEHKRLLEKIEYLESRMLFIERELKPVIGTRGWIYCGVEPTTGKRYIGQTIKRAEKRYDTHRQHKTGPYSDDAEDITWSVIERVHPMQLDERESYWIGFYNTYPDGFNRTRGNDRMSYEKGLLAAAENGFNNDASLCDLGLLALKRVATYYEDHPQFFCQVSASSSENTQLGELQADGSLALLRAGLKIIFAADFTASVILEDWKTRGWLRQTACESRGSTYLTRAKLGKSLHKRSIVIHTPTFINMLATKPLTGN